MNNKLTKKILLISGIILGIGLIISISIHTYLDSRFIDENSSSSEDRKIAKKENFSFLLDYYSESETNSILFILSNLDLYDRLESFDYVKNSYDDTNHSFYVLSNDNHEFLVYIDKTDNNIFLRVYDSLNNLVYGSKK